MTNIGNGSGWSHPIHLHGHSFYVMKMGFASYNETSAKLIPNMGQDQQDIKCPDDNDFCSTAQWKNASWSNGNHPSLNRPEQAYDFWVTHLSSCPYRLYCVSQYDSERTINPDYLP
jgi:FtsP/CotA-like multicopper oxidase with cupredoxin domain